MSNRKQFIFRWKDDGIEVKPSRANTPEEVWAWALKNLRGATEKASNAIARIKRQGEVVEYEP